MVAFPVVDIVGQQGNAVRQYQMLEFKVIKELQTTVAQQGPTVPFTQVLLHTVMEINSTPQD